MKTVSVILASIAAVLGLKWLEGKDCDRIFRTKMDINLFEHLKRNPDDEKLYINNWSEFTGEVTEE